MLRTVMGGKITMNLLEIVKVREGFHQFHFYVPRLHLYTLVCVVCTMLIAGLHCIAPLPVIMSTWSNFWLSTEPVFSLQR